MTIPLNSNTLLAWLTAFDAGTLTTDETVTLFQYMLDDYSVWSMGKKYAEMAEFLLRMGYCLLSAAESEHFKVPAPACDLAAVRKLRANPLHATPIPVEEGDAAHCYLDTMHYPGPQEKDEVQCFWCQSYVSRYTVELIGRDPATGENMWWCGCEQE